jgi:hypothetical protein
MCKLVLSGAAPFRRGTRARPIGGAGAGAAGRGRRGGGGGAGAAGGAPAPSRPGGAVVGAWDFCVPRRAAPQFRGAPDCPPRAYPHLRGATLTLPRPRAGERGQAPGPQRARSPPAPVIDPEP